MKHYDLHKRSNEHNAGAAIVAVFGAAVIATILWPPLGDILTIAFLIIVIVLGLALIGFAVWMFEPHPPSWSRHDRELDPSTVGHPAVPVLNGQPLSRDLPDLVAARAYQGGDP